MDRNWKGWMIGEGEGREGGRLECGDCVKRGEWRRTGLEKKENSEEATDGLLGGEWRTAWFFVERSSGRAILRQAQLMVRYGTSTPGKVIG